MMQPRLKHFGWGREGEGLTPDEEAFVLGQPIHSLRAACPVISHC
jgi:hypothetical protein